jgi:GrpB-like predicted nucleotidyltransferase (UPF0157 family)
MPEIRFTTEEELRAAAVGELRPLSRPIVIAPYDPNWPRAFERESAKIRSALGQHVLELHHAGSTAVPGLAAKPIIDIVLVVESSADENTYVPALEDVGYVLRIREPEWFEHRMLRGTDPEVNLHVFSKGCDEIVRMLAFRDHLRADDADRELYERTKRDLASREWKFGQHYADAKSAVVAEIMARATAT